MPILTASNTVYTHPVAKVMISIPDKLLKRLDAHAKAAGNTRSGLLQRLVEREVDDRERERQDEVNRLLDSLNIDLGGRSAAEVVREDRESH
jgi:metal-responsive CopG/Arc/MetJ family transcriptional regulator